MDHTSQVAVIDKVSKATPILALALSLLLAFNAISSKFSVSDWRGSDNTAQIEALKTQANLQQRQLDRDAAIEERLKNLSEQNQITQQEVHDLSVNLQSFESRFIVIPSSSSRR